MVTVNDKGYTKHYFEEGKRICSKIGSGELRNVDDWIGHMGMNYEEQRSIQFDGVTKTYEQCMNITPHVKNRNLYKDIIKQYEYQVSSDEPSFYYHSDHLGSASFLTDETGLETQQLVYLPFGEDWVDKKYNTSQFETPYKFNGKEKDQETGYNYYGARYLNNELSIWLSVDPLSDKYPHLTSYNYCANNPVMLIDPDGRDIDITGPEKEKGFDEFRKGAERYGVKSSMDNDGRVSGEYVGKDPISEEAKQLVDAINNPKIHIELRTTDSEKINGTYFIGGAFMGNNLRFSQSKIGKDDYLLPTISGVDAYQIINPRLLAKMDNFAKKPGQSTIHEVLEAYTGAKMALKKGIGSPMAGVPGSFYPEVHNNTIVPQSIENIHTNYYDAKGNLTDKDNAVKLTKYAGCGSKKLIIQTR